MLYPCPSLCLCDVLPNRSPRDTKRIANFGQFLAEDSQPRSHLFLFPFPPLTSPITAFNRGQQVISPRRSKQISFAPIALFLYFSGLYIV